MSSSPYKEVWLPGPQSTQFYTRTYACPSTPKAVIVFVHGFAEHVGRYTHFHPLFAANGITVFTFDQRGFGRTAQDEKEKSKGSAYGKTSWADGMRDIDWAVGHVKKEWPEVPVFLMGHSMGGGLLLGLATRGTDSPHKETLSSLSGIIATSPLVQQTKPASKLLRWIGGKASLIAPNTLITAPVSAPELSHDPAFNDAYLKDPLIKPLGSLRGVGDMLTGGEQLIQTHYKYWPETLPVLFIHGTEDQVTSHKATETFYDKISAKSKKLSLFPGGFHELQNEPDGVKEKVVDETVAFIEEHLATKPLGSSEAAPSSKL